MLPYMLLKLYFKFLAMMSLCFFFFYSLHFATQPSWIDSTFLIHKTQTTVCFPFRRLGVKHGLYMACQSFQCNSASGFKTTLFEIITLISKSSSKTVFHTMDG